MRKNLILLLAVLVLGSGCEQRDLLTEDLLDSQMASMKIDDLNRTLDFVFSDGRFDQGEFEDTISTGLSRWSGEVVKNGDYKNEFQLNPEFQELVDSYQGLPVVQRIEELSFLKSDGYYIQQAAWLKQIGDRVTGVEIKGMHELYHLLAAKAGGEGEGFESDIAALHSDLEEGQAKELAAAIRLFDWVTRNIQLTPEPVFDEEQRAEICLDDTEGISEEEAGIPGLGYKHYPWQTLLYARGDYVQRAKLFMVLCEQMGLEAVMLACNGEDDELIPWLPAVAVGGKLYLFDSYLGLPVFSERPGQIATLADVRKSDKLLTGLDLTVEETTRDDAKYRIRPEQIKELTALIYVSPESISHRMQFLEDRLLGDRRLRLTAKPDQTRESLKGIEAVNPVIWDIGFRTQQFRNVVKSASELVNEDSQLITKLTWFFDEEDYVDRFVAYRTARNLYFIGKFETERNSRRANAVQRFRSIMYTQDEIDGLATNRRLLYQLGIMKEEGQDVNSFNNRLRGTQAQMELVRRDAGYFLAQSTFDNGNIPTSANWLKRVEEKGYSERWNTGVDYLTGRAYEARKEYKRAIELYGKGEFEQFHGNLLRARLLKEASEQ
jgi:hypothetical protein